MYEVENYLLCCLRSILRDCNFHAKTLIYEIKANARQAADYLYGYMLMCSLHVHADPLYEFSDMALICERRQIMIDCLDTQQRQNLNKMSWRERMLTQANTFLLSIIIYSFSKMKDVGVLFNPSTEFLFSGLGPRTLAQFSQMYSKTHCYVRDEILRVEIDHSR